MNKKLLALLVCVCSLGLLSSCRKDCYECDPCDEQTCETRYSVQDECPGCEDCDPNGEHRNVEQINKF